MIIDEFRKLGIEIPTVLLPEKNVDLTKWAVVACDQYTSQPDYWESVARLVEENASTLNLVFPEVYLEKDSVEDRIEKINSTMRKYLKENSLIPQSAGFILVDRKTIHTESRKGLILSLDLEEYDYNKGSQTLIRATEGTVVDRLPPRIKIRENASIELPHIMVLIDDPEKTVIEPISKLTDKLQKLYDFDLMMGGGHINGYMVDNEEILQNFLKALEKLTNQQEFRSKYGVGDDKGLLLFAVGDGNHSLASAKGHWENVKKNLTNEEQLKHPARFALVELVNVHDDGLKFEPIHRVIFNVNPKHLLDSMKEFVDYTGCKTFLRFFNTKLELQRELKILENKGSHNIAFVTKTSFGIISVDSPKCTLEVGTLQAFLEEYSRINNNIKIDYIHGEDVVDTLGSGEGTIGFYLPSMNKNDLFKTVIIDGALPKKTFSMGEADEKRFYLESRKIVL